MFNVLKKIIWGDPNNPDIVQIPSGSLFVVRPNSPKGQRECIFNNANATIRRTGTDFHYQLVVTRIYDEGEEELDDDDEELQDEASFLLDEQMKLHKGQFEGCVSFVWSDAQETSDFYEFICDVATTAHLANTFELTLLQCIYERKHRKSHFGATEEEVREVAYVPSTPKSGREKTPAPPATPTKSAKSDLVTPVKNSRKPRTSAAPAPANSESQALVSVRCELYLFDPSTGHFNINVQDVKAEIYRTAPYQFWLVVTEAANGQLVVSQSIEATMNAVINQEHSSFIWNYYDDDGNCFSWSLKYSDPSHLKSWQIAFSTANFETSNKQSFGKAKPDEQNYILNAYQDDVDMPDAVLANEEVESEETDEEEEEEETDEESEDEISPEGASDNANPGEKNSQLAIGYKHDRSFVVRGSRIGVFKHTNDDSLEFSTTINTMKDKKGNSLAPAKVMLHEEDSQMLMLDPKNPHGMYKMDLEYGKVVEEWDIDENIPCTNIIPDSKYSQMTPQKTFIGMSHNTLFRVDPRLSGAKLVAEQCKQYATKNDFSCVAATASGKVAVGSNKGDIRLYNKLGIAAKSALPALGDPILGIDASNTGKWVIATCKTYLLLIDTEIKDTNQVYGFDKSFPNDKKPIPKRLQLRPEHVSYMNAPISFTPARFNTGENEEEKTIVTSTGPYVITWNFRRVKQGKYYDYQIRKYEQDVVADNFRYGADRSIVVALPNDVQMASKKTLRTPNKVLQTPTRKLRSRSDIVNSPY